MEGNRHERSLLVAVSYIIGFVTAFIFYQDKLNKTEAYNPADYQTTILQNSNLKNNQNQIKTDSLEISPKTDAVSRGEKLNEKDNELILDTVSLTSSEGDFTFYCKPSTAEGLCRAYVLDIKNSLSYPVFLDNNELLMSESLVSDIRWNNNYLKIGDYISISSQKPWLLQELVPR